MSGGLRLTVGALLTLLTVGLVFFDATSTLADEHFNSAEPGCDGSDPTVLWCDDFEDASWYVYDGNNQAPSDDGWLGWREVENDYGDPTGNGSFAQCGGKGVGGTNCAAYRGNITDPHGRGGAFHAFRDEDQFNEIYLRFYFYLPADGYLAHEKLFGVGSPKAWGENSNLDYFNSVARGHEGRQFIQATSFGASPNSCDKDPTQEPGGWCYHNVSPLKFSPGKWHYIEAHYKLNTEGNSDGVYELWMDDCGTDGLGCTGQGTLRARFTDVEWGYPWHVTGIHHVWFLFWAPDAGNGWTPPHSSGDRGLDQIVVATRRIGPMGAAPVVPGALNVPGTPSLITRR